MFVVFAAGVGMMIESDFYASESLFLAWIDHVHALCALYVFALIYFAILTVCARVCILHNYNNSWSWTPAFCGEIKKRYELDAQFKTTANLKTYDLFCARRVCVCAGPTVRHVWIRMDTVWVCNCACSVLSLCWFCFFLICWLVGRRSSTAYRKLVRSRQPSIWRFDWFVDVCFVSCKRHNLCLHVGR